MLDRLNTLVFRSDLLGLDAGVLLTVTLATATDCLAAAIAVFPPAHVGADIYTFGKVTLKGWIGCRG